MTTITLPRATVEQALEALYEETAWFGPTPKGAVAITALRAALAQQAEPRNQCRSDGRCQYAIDHGAEGMGHCPRGKCVMAQHTQPAEDRAVAQSNLRVMKEMFREQAEPLTIERLRDALVASRIIPPAAVEDPEEYDDGVTLHRIEALHRRMNMTNLRTAAQQAIGLICRARLCEINSMSSRQEMLRLLIEAIDTLRAALAQQAEPVAYTTGHCENHKQKGGCQLHNLQCGWPDCDRKPSAALAQQAEPEPQTCTWQQDGDSDSGVYSTSCRRYFNLEDGTPEDNQMAWCCYCGKKLVQELIAEDEHD